MIAPPIQESRRACVSPVCVIFVSLALSVPALLLFNGEKRHWDSLLAEGPQAKDSSGVFSETPSSQNPQAEDAWDLLVKGDLQEDRVYLAKMAQAAEAEAEAHAAKEARLTLARLRREPFALSTETRLASHPYVLAAENCSLTLEQRRAFAGEQHAVQLSDARSFALLAGNAEFRPASLTGVQPPPARTPTVGGASLRGTELFHPEGTMV